MTAKEIIEKYWESVNSRDWVTFKTLVDDEVIYKLPQTREMIKGSSALSEFNETYPGEWTIEVLMIIVGESSKAASKIKFIDKGSVQIGLSFFEMKNNRISNIEEYWPEDYEPPLRASKSVLRY